MTPGKGGTSLSLISLQGNEISPGLYVVVEKALRVSAVFDGPAEQKHNQVKRGKNPPETEAGPLRGELWAKIKTTRN